MGKALANPSNPRKSGNPKDGTPFRAAVAAEAVPKVDPALVIIAVLAVAALVLTGVGVAKSDAWTDERSYRFTAATVDLAAQGPTPASATPARFEWAAPVNATGLRLNATVAFTGQAVQGGSATVRITVIAPDGHALPSVTRALNIGQGATSASLDIGHAVTWADVPSTVRDTQQPESMAWGKPIVVQVSVDRPSDVPVATYAFTVSVTATATTFAA